MNEIKLARITLTYLSKIQIFDTTGQFMYHHLYGYLEEFKILFPFKFGFRE